MFKKVICIFVLLVLVMGQVQAQEATEEPTPCKTEQAGVVTLNLTACTAQELADFTDSVRENLGVEGDGEIITDLAPPVPIAIGESESWKIELYEGVTKEMVSWGSLVPPLDPVLWVEFFQEDNGPYLAKNGLEYGIHESAYCESADPCSIVVPARHYRLITGDGEIPALGYSCVSTNGRGCVLVIVNVGDVTAVWEGKFNSVFTVPGRYWNGGVILDENDVPDPENRSAMPTAIWSLTSHGVSRMLNMPSSLNPGGDVTNAGSNCSVPEGCSSAHVEYDITSGSQPLLKAQSDYPSDEEE